jgi:PST family polysaccharide transporter
MALTMPLTVACALFGEDIILVVLGRQWTEAVPVFRLLTPTVLVFSIINPLAWLLLSSGLQRRSLHLAMVIAPLVICAVVLGLPYGPTGVAFAYSAAMCLWVVPHVLWCLHGTNVAPRDLAIAAARPLFATFVAGLVAFAVHYAVQGLAWPFARLAIACAVMAAVHFAMLWFVLAQRAVYLDLLRGLRTAGSPT